MYHDISEEPARASLRIYYSTRNLIEVMRKQLEDVAKAEFSAHASDEAEVVQDLATVWGLVGQDTRLS